MRMRTKVHKLRVVTVEQTANDADAPEPDNVNRQVSGSAGEHPDVTALTLAEQQMRDPEIGWLVCSKRILLL